MIINFYYRNNDLLKDGKLDEQIIADLEAYIKEQNRYQKEHLDVRVKTEAPHHYDAWTEKTQSQIKYAERILECVKTQKEAHWIKHEWAEEENWLLISNYECSKCHTWKREKSEYCPDCGCKMTEVM